MAHGVRYTALDMGKNSDRQTVFRLRGLLAGRLAVSPLLPLTLLPMIVVVAIVVVCVWISFQSGLVGTADAKYSLQNYATLANDPFILKVLANTLVFAVATTFVSLVVGLPVAWITERTTIRPKELIYAMMTTGLLVPSLFIAMGWTFIANQRIGLLNKALMGIFGLQNGPIRIGSPAGMGFVQGLTLAPLAFVLCVQVFRAMSPALEEAALTSGMSFRRTLWRVSLPLARPAILATLIYIFVIGIATFDIPAVIGLSDNVYVFSTYVFTEAFPTDGLPKYGIPAALGTAMLFVALTLTLWYVQMLRRSQGYQVITGKGYRARQLDVGRWVIACWVYVLFYFFFGLLLPILLVAFMAFMPYLSPPTVSAFHLLTLANFQHMDWEYVFRGLRNTVILMIIVPPVVVVIAFCVSWLVVRSRLAVRYLLEFGAFLPHAIPQVVIAIGSLLLSLYVIPRFLPIYGTVWILVGSYVIVWLPFATRALNSSLIQIHRELEEAASTSGLPMSRAVRRILVPLLRPTLLSVWIWTALLVYREITIAVFLVSQDNVTLPAVVWSTWSMGNANAAAAITVLMMAAFLPLVLMAWRFARRSRLSAEI